MAIKEQVGERFYIFRDGDRRSEHLIIYSHGGYYPWTTRFRVPDAATLYFYGPDRELLTTTNMNILRVVAGARHCETATAGEQVRNYFLTKYYLRTMQPAPQDLPAGTRTYELILQAIDGVRQQIAQQEAQRALGNEPPADVGVLPRMDVLTVRNRRMRPPTGLSDAVRAAHELGYRRFHCYFCRSPVVSWAKPREHWLDSNSLDFPH